MHSRVEKLEKAISKLTLGQGTVKAVRFQECAICGEGHRAEECPAVKHTESENVNFVQNQKNPFNNLQDQPRESTMRELMAQLTQTQLHNSAQLTQLANLAKDQVKINESVANDIREIKSTLGRVCEAINEREPGRFPSGTKNSRNEQVNAISLRSGKVLEDHTKKSPERKPYGNITTSFPLKLNTYPDPPFPERLRGKKEEKVEEEKSEVQIEQTVENDSKREKEVNEPKVDIQPSPPFPQRLSKSMKKQEKGFQQFLDSFRKLAVNIPFIEVLEQMPNYAKYMREVLSKKKKLRDYSIVALTEECSAVLQKKLPQKLKDPGSFKIPCAIGDRFFGKALCDLGASINLMPLSVFQKLGVGEAKPTSMCLQLTDRSIIHPWGLVEDVIVKVGKLYLPADFVVVDMDEDEDVPILLGRPFLATGRAKIDVQKGEVELRVEDEQEKLHVFSVIEVPEESRECKLNSFMMQREKLHQVLHELESATGMSTDEIKGASPTFSKILSCGDVMKEPKFGSGSTLEPH